MANDLEIPFRNFGGDANAQPTASLSATKGPDSSSLGRALRVVRKVRDAGPAVRAWQAKAKMCDRMYHGHQWEDYDRMVMEQGRRPCLTFNDIQKIVRAVTGLERMNRTDVRVITRAIDSPVPEDAAGDLATEALAAVDELSQAHIERSLCVEDLAKTGMAWFECFIDFSEELDGQILKQRLPWDEMYWDHHARRPGLVDTQWRCRKREMPKELFEQRWPDMVDLVEGAAPEPPEWSIQKYELVTPNYSLANQRANPEVSTAGSNKGTITVYQFQERYEATVYRIVDPDNENELLELSEKFWKDLVKDLKAEGLPSPANAKQTRSKIRQMYVANGLELEDPEDLPGNYWTLIPMTGEWDQEDKMFKGIVPPMIDPQQTKNKSLSSGLDFYLHNAKGGLLHEKGAFVNATRAKDDWAKQDAWIELQEGGLKKLQPRQAQALPQGLQVFWDLSSKAVTEVMGVGPEFMGVSEQEVGNQTQQSRLTAALAIFGWFFDEISRFRKEEARITFSFIHDFMTDGQMMQIGGPFNSKSIPLLKENLPKKYKFSIDESIKHNPNLKAKIWQDLQPIIPAIMKSGPVGMKFLLYCLKFTSLPAQLVDMLAKESQDPKNQQQQQGKGKQENPMLVQGKVQKLSADAQKSLAEARSLDLKGKLSVIETYLDAVKVNAEVKSQKHKGKLDQLGLLQSLIPGVKGESNGKGGGELNGQT